MVRSIPESCCERRAAVTVKGAQEQTHAPQQKTLLDDLVGDGQQCRWNLYTECSRRLQVEDELVVDCTTGRSAGLAPLRMRPV
jgi:hypothetical protein